jgi:DNA processing protein
VKGSAPRWALLNLRLAGKPGLRREILRRAADRAGRPVSLLEIAGDTLCGDPISPAFGAGGPDQRAAFEEIERARRFGAGILTLQDAAYPALLKASADPPPLLYLLGPIVPEDALAVAVVGSRRPTPRGITIAREIAAGLAAAGFTVVSGLARGIDAAAHQGALAAGGRTLAFLGSGLDRIYPSEHLKLAKEISGRGAVLSEFPFGTPPLKIHFPERNRSIAWITWATVVIEAARDSGSLITARLAADEGRLVFAVPGTVGDPNAEGTNALLREGALLCRSAEDILEDLAPQVVEAARALPSADRGAAAQAVRAGGGRAPGFGGAAGPGDPAGTGGAAPLREDERRVLASIPATRGIGIERLGEASGIAPGPLLAILLELELRGLVRQLPGRRFIAFA